MNAWIRDFRHASRHLAKRPVTSILAVACLALGIGPATAVFSVVETVLVRPLPFPQPESLMAVWDTNLQQGQTESLMSPSNLIDVRASIGEEFEGLAAYMLNSYTLTGVENPEELNAADVTADFFSVLGAEAVLGRTFAVGDDAAGRTPPVVLSHRLWVRLFNRDAGVLGRTIEMDERPFEIVGIMDDRFATPSSQVGLWVAQPLNARVHRASRYMNAYARLAPGVSIERAQSALESISVSLEELGPRANVGWRMRLVPLHEQIVGDSRAYLLFLTGAVMTILLIAGLNVAHLILARISERDGELALLQTLGASSRQLARRLFSESLILVAVGSLGGVLLGAGLMRWITSLETSLPRISEIRFDGPAVAFALGLSLTLAMIFSAIPWLRSLRLRPAEVLKESGQRNLGLTQAKVRTRSILVAAEVALTVVLLVLAGLLLRSFLRVITVDPGFRTENVLVVRLFLDGRDYARAADRHQYYQSLSERLAQLPGVRSVGAVTALPLSPVSNNYDLPYRLTDRPNPPAGQEPQADYRAVTPGYFQTMGIRLMQGRLIDETDRLDSQPVVVINQTMARTLWPNESPIGRFLQIPYSGWKSRQVVGVVDDTRYYGHKAVPKAEMFYPHQQISFAPGGMHIVLNTEPGQLSPLADHVRRTMTEVDRNQPPHSVTNMKELTADYVAPDRFASQLLVLLSAVATMLSGFGIYGILAHTVSLRTQEFGVRMALGASSSSLRQQVLRESLPWVLSGLTAGLALASLASRMTQTLLYQTDPIDLSVYVSVAAFLALVAAAAAYLPARRASSLNPICALRSQ